MHGKKMSALPDHTQGSKLKGRLSQAAILVALGLGLISISPRTWAQGPVSINPFPPSSSPAQILFYDGSSNLIYLCQAKPIQTGSHAPTWAVTPVAPQLTLTNIVVSSNVGTITVSGSTIKLQVGNKVVVSGSATTALNGTYAVATAPTSTTVTIATSGVSNGTYNDSTLLVSSTAPRSDDGVWTIEKLSYSGANLVNVQWAQGSSGNMTNICDNRATLTYQ